MTPSPLLRIVVGSTCVASLACRGESPTPAPDPGQPLSDPRSSTPNRRSTLQTPTPENCPSDTRWVPSRPTEPELAAFCLQVHEVTVAEYRHCVSAGACTEPDPLERPSTYHGDDPGLPVNYASLEQARAYCKHVGGRLPTSEEWRWAKSSAGKSRFPWGDLVPAGFLACGHEPLEPRRTCVGGSTSLDESEQGIVDLACGLDELVDATSDEPAGAISSTCPHTPPNGVVPEQWAKQYAGHFTAGSDNSYLIGFRCVRASG